MTSPQTNGSTDWEAELSQWLEPFLARFGHKAQRRWAPIYLQGLLGPSRRKNMERVATSVAPDDVQQLHHFISTSQWNPAPLQEELAQQADAIVGGDDAHLIIDDTSVVKKGKHSVGVAHQYCGELGKSANCQSLVSLTLAREEVPVPIGLQLYLTKSWADDRARCQKAGVPEEVVYKTKWQIALEEIDRVIAAGIRFGDVLADVGYGGGSEFRHGLTKRGLKWAVGITPNQGVYPADVVLKKDKTVRGRPRKHPVPSVESISAEDYIASLGKRAFRKISWRRGTKGVLKADFAISRVRVADGGRAAHRKRLPGEIAWLICERRTPEDLRYYLCNYPPSASKRQLVAAIKARWSCEQAHQQLKQELGLDHFEGRSWNGLHHHALLTMIAFAFLQKLRWKQKKLYAKT
jgi:SRSO17 transposase